MQFIVPQFIEVESKIIGPISVRQFIILLITIGMIFLSFRLFSTLFAGLFTFFVGTIGGVIAFGKVNGQPMHYFILNIVQTLKRPPLKVWKRLPYALIEQAPIELHHAAASPKRLASRSRLAEMSLLVDTGGAYSGESILSPQAPQEEKKDQQQNQNSSFTIR